MLTRETSTCKIEIVMSQTIAQPTLDRTCALILLITALGGAWSLEQPQGSLLEFYPTWRFILQMISKIGGPSAVMALNLWRDHDTYRPEIS